MGPHECWHHRQCPAPTGPLNPGDGRNHNREVQTNEVVDKLIPDNPGQDTEEACQPIYPLVRKVRMLMKARFGLGHSRGFKVKIALLNKLGDERGTAVQRAGGSEPLVQELFKIQTLNGDKLKILLV